MILNETLFHKFSNSFSKKQKIKFFPNFYRLLYFKPELHHFARENKLKFFFKSMTHFTFCRKFLCKHWNVY